MTSSNYIVVGGEMQAGAQISIEPAFNDELLAAYIANAVGAVAVSEQYSTTDFTFSHLTKPQIEHKIVLAVEALKEKGLKARPANFGVVSLDGNNRFNAGRAT